MSQERIIQVNPLHSRAIAVEFRAAQDAGDYRVLQVMGPNLGPRLAGTSDTSNSSLTAELKESTILDYVPVGSPPTCLGFVTSRWGALRGEEFCL